MSILKVGAGIALAALMFVCVGCFGLIAYQGNLFDSENAVITQNASCMTQLDNAISQVTAAVNVNAAYYNDLRDLFQAAVTGPKDGQPGTVNQIMSVLIGNGVISATDYSKVQLEVLRIIETTYSQYNSCQLGLLISQTSFANAIGRTVGSASRDGKFPNSQIAAFFGYPHILTGPRAPKKDLDGDGLITALDYQPLLSKDVTDAYDKGVLPPNYRNPTGK